LTRGQFVTTMRGQLRPKGRQVLHSCSSLPRKADDAARNSGHRIVSHRLALSRRGSRERALYPAPPGLASRAQRSCGAGREQLAGERIQQVPLALRQGAPVLHKCEIYHGPELATGFIKAYGAPVLHESGIYHGMSPFIRRLHDRSVPLRLVESAFPPASLLAANTYLFPGHALTSRQGGTLSDAATQHVAGVLPCGRPSHPRPVRPSPCGPPASA